MTARESLLLNAFVPSSSDCASASSLHVVAYVTDANEAACVAPMAGVTISGKTGAFKVASVQWRNRNDLLVTAAQGRDVSRFEIDYQASDRKWGQRRARELPPQGQPVSSPATRPVRVEVLRSANDPWKVIAGSAGETIPLSLPDPALADVQIVPTTPFAWKVGTEEDVGGLYVPVHRHIRNPRAAGHSGRSLRALPIPAGRQRIHCLCSASARCAGNGGAQYQRRSGAVPETGLSVEAAMTKRIDAVVEALDRAGIIDPLKVGLIGFSHSGFQVHYLATHPGAVKLAAGVVADSFAGSYGQYTFLDSAMMDSRASQSQMERFMGGSQVLG